jgi:hypothetical protein
MVVRTYSKPNSGVLYTHHTDQCSRMDARRDDLDHVARIAHLAVQGYVKESELLETPSAWVMLGHRLESESDASLPVALKVFKSGQEMNARNERNLLTHLASSGSSKNYVVQLKDIADVVVLPDGRRVASCSVLEMWDESLTAVIQKIKSESKSGILNPVMKRKLQRQVSIVLI